MRKTIHREIGNRPDISRFLSSSEDMIRLFDLPSPIEKNRVAIFKELYDGIGNTPLITIKLKNQNRLHIKLEYENTQGHNHYSRYWIPYLWIGETLGLLSPELDEILEISSGSSGIALSNACQHLGYKLSMIIPNSLPNARVLPMESPNTTLIKVDGYIDACVSKLKEIISEDKLRYFIANHAEERANIITQVFSRIAHEYIAIESTPPDYAILAVGNGTSAEGVSSVFQSFPQNRNKNWVIGFHPNYNLGQANPVLGLLPENVKFKHVEILREQNLMDSIEFTNEYEIVKLRKHYSYDSELANFGESSVYALGIANKLASRVSQKNFFSIAYDHANRYD